MAPTPGSHIKGEAAAPRLRITTHGQESQSRHSPSQTPSLGPPLSEHPETPGPGWMSPWSPSVPAASATQDLIAEPPIQGPPLHPQQQVPLSPTVGDAPKHIRSSQPRAQPSPMVLAPPTEPPGTLGCWPLSAPWVLPPSLHPQGSNTNQHREWGCAGCSVSLAAPPALAPLTVPRCHRDHPGRALLMSVYQMVLSPTRVHSPGLHLTALSPRCWALPSTAWGVLWDIPCWCEHPRLWCEHPRLQCEHP